MAIVYPAETSGGAGESWTDRIEQHPVTAFALVLILALMVGYVISKLRGTSTSSTTPTSSTQPDVLYYPTQNTFENNTTNNTLPPGPVPGSAPGRLPPGPVPGSATTRAKGTDPSWDKNNSGVPLRPGTSPAGQVTLIPFGTSVTLGAPVQGSPAWNGGPNEWYPVSYNGKSGYLSSFDVVLSNAANAIGSGAASLFDRLRMAIPLWN